MTMRMVVLVLALALPRGQSDAPGSLLRVGTQLVYHANDSAQPAWIVDSVLSDPAPRTGSRCTVLYLRRRPDRPAEVSRLCLSNDTLFSWNVPAGDWRIQRPVGPGMRHEITRPNGDRVLYETAEKIEERISGRTVPVVITTVLTTDSTGRPKRRLRERYSVGLATATGGVFEVPDSTSAGGWRTEQAFELREIRIP